MASDPHPLLGPSRLGGLRRQWAPGLGSASSPQTPSVPTRSPAACALQRPLEGRHTFPRPRGGKGTQSECVPRPPWGCTQTRLGSEDERPVCSIPSECCFVRAQFSGEGSSWTRCGMVGRRWGSSLRSPCKYPHPHRQERGLTRQTLEGYIHAMVQPEATGRADQLGDGTGCLLIVLEVPG